MQKLTSPGEFPTLAYFATFSGKSHDDAKGQAHAWEKETGATLVSYFEQKPINRSYGILVSYLPKKNENTNQ